MRYNTKSKLKITPFAIWICVLLPIIENMLVANFSKFTSIFHGLEALVLLGLVVINVINKMGGLITFEVRSREKSKNKVIENVKLFLLTIVNSIKERKKVKFFVIMFSTLIILNLVTVFSAHNIYILQYFRFYLLHFALITFLLTDTKLFLSEKEYKKSYFNYPIIFFSVLNYIGCILISFRVKWFMILTQGDYADVRRFNRYNLYQYSGIFAWPNHLSYVALALYIVSLYVPVNKYVKYSLVTLIFLSVNRSTIIVMLGVLIFEFYGFIKNKFQDKYFRRIVYGVSSLGIFIFVLLKHKTIIPIITSLINELFSLNKMGHRSLMIMDSFNAFKEHFLFGVGVRRIGELSIALQNKDTAILKYFPQISANVTSDTFFTIFAEVGILGLLVIFLMVLKIYNDNDKNMKLLITVLLVVSYSLYNPFSFILTAYSYCLLFVCYLKRVKPYKAVGTDEK